MHFALTAFSCLLATSHGMFPRPAGLLVGTFDDAVEARVAEAAASTVKKTVSIRSNASTSTTSDAATTGWGTFDQLIDHSNPELGTFPQRFWYGTHFWAGPGAPVVLVTPGEQSGTGFNYTYLTSQRITGRFAEAVGGAVVVLEHRYWGESVPFADLTVAHLRHLTVDNARRDLAYFAEHFEPPFDATGASAPSRAPWILAGGSYAGALAAWEAAADTDMPGTAKAGNNFPFWAYYATSAVVEAIDDFWQYFDAVRAAAPANCSADLVAVAEYVDEVLLRGSNAQKDQLKARFLLEDLEDADFANALAYGPYLWQETQYFLEAAVGYNPFHQFCDNVENVWPNATGAVPGPTGVGACKALDGYALWFTQKLLPGLCESYGLDDFQGTYNTGCLANLNASSPLHTDISAEHAFNRPWMWLTCNEPLAWFQDAAPSGRPSIVSRQVNYTYHLAQCALMFPEAAGSFGLDQGRTLAQTNAATGGWSVPSSATPRLMYANGELDPWRPATVSADGRPGGPLASSAEVPVHVLPGGGHCSDVYAENWAVNADAEAAAQAQTDILAGWVDDFYVAKAVQRPSAAVTQD